MSGAGGEAGPRVIPIIPELAPAAADAVARAFADNEIWLWMVGSERLLHRLLPRHYRIMIRRIFIPRGGAWTTPDAAGAALWIPPERNLMTRSEEMWDLLSILPEGVPGLRRGVRWDAAVKRHRPTDPHWYLNTLAVDPGHQRSGVGSALIAPGLERADAAGVGCYLETQRRSNIPFYRRFGFEETGEVAVLDSPPVWLMWRDPQHQGRV